MSNSFGILLDILKEAFTTHASEKDYHMIVEVLRKYVDSPCDTSVEHDELAKRGWPLTYHPCHHMERIRYAIQFSRHDNLLIKELIQTLP